jgi:hypothetical protein
VKSKEFVEKAAEAYAKTSSCSRLALSRRSCGERSPRRPDFRCLAETNFSSEAKIVSIQSKRSENDYLD